MKVFVSILYFTQIVRKKTFCAFSFWGLTCSFSARYHERTRVCTKWKTREMKVFATLEFFPPMDRKKTICAFSSWELTCCSFHSTILCKYIIPDILSAYFCGVQNIPEYCNLIPDILCTLNLKGVLMDSHLNLPLQYSNIFISQIATLWHHM